jgi:hypothetical protein
VEALLLELCTEHGWCGALRELETISDLRDERSVVDAILAAEGSEVADVKTRAWLGERVRDWLFDPDGRGSRSGLAE